MKTVLRPARLLVAGLLLVSACSDSRTASEGPGLDQGADTTPSSPSSSEVVASAEVVTSGGGDQPLPEGARGAIDTAVDDVIAMIGESTNPVDPAHLAALGEFDDIRMAWLMVDLGQFVFRGEALDALVASANRLTDEQFTTRTFWRGLGDTLITDDVPAPPGYVQWKQQLLTAVDVTWVHFFNDSEANVDWRHVTFGGVLADNRPFGSDESCSCIAALDNPPAVPAAEGDWYPDHRIVFGLVVDGEARAYPLNVMEVHELANDELGGRRISLTYCTLCRSAVAFFVDDLDPGVTPPVLRTSGLLQRSNKLVFDRETKSLVDQFTGEGLSGPLREQNVQLERLTVVTSTWAEWRNDHPNTTLMAGEEGNAANYPLEPLGDRDAGGPIFPIGDVDETLFASQRVIGTILDEGRVVAFPVDVALEALEGGDVVESEGVRVVTDGSGLRLTDEAGDDLASSQANWFAWSQRFPRTLLWQP